MRLLGYLLAAKAIKTGVVCGITGRPYSFPPADWTWRCELFAPIGRLIDELEFFWLARDVPGDQSIHQEAGR